MQLLHGEQRDLETSIKIITIMVPPFQRLLKLVQPEVGRNKAANSAELLRAMTSDADSDIIIQLFTYFLHTII
jgi:hypothetical protein